MKLRFLIKREEICPQLYFQMMHSQKIRININLKVRELKDPENMAFNQSQIGHRGNGDYRIEIQDLNNKEYVMYLIKQ